MTAQLKCVVWDLDDTLWDGTLAENDRVRPREEALALVRRLDGVGVVQSLASKNDPVDVDATLATIGLADTFVYPQVSWSAKSDSLRRILELVDVGADTVVFLDDSPFERAEVSQALPAVRCYSLAEFLALDATDALVPTSVTTDGVRRPAAYREEARRKAAQESFVGTPAEFLESLGMVLTVRRVTPTDLDRAAELTARTNQLNTTGRTYSSNELAVLCDDPDHLVLVAELVDRFGDYGRVGLVMIECTSSVWLVNLMLMSCRVGGRNVGNALIGVLARLASSRGVSLEALFIPSGRNRQMRITYGMLGFVRDRAYAGGDILAHPAQARVIVPSYFQVVLGSDVLENTSNNQRNA